MKTFSTNFTTEKSKKTGTSPVWILKCPFTTGTLYLSDRSFTIASWNGGIVTKSWIKAWGQVDENIDSQLAVPHIADFTITVINDQNYAPNIETVLWNPANKPETTDCELYLWFLDLNPATDPPEKMFVGNIIDFEQEDELVYRLHLVDQSLRYDKYIGTVISTDTYPNADPDDVGKIGNIGYGVLKEVPALSVVAGALDYLDAATTAEQTTLNLIDASRFPASGSIGIDGEDITYTGKSGNQLTGLTRGANSTTAVVHGRGSPVWEERTDFTYEAFSHPIKQYDNIYAVGNNTKLKITSICTQYTGNPGSQHPSWPNKAMVVIPAKITREQAINLLTEDGITIDHAIEIVEDISVRDRIDVKDLLDVDDNITVDQGQHTHTAAALTLSVRVEDWYNVSGSWKWQSNASYRFDGDFTTGDYIDAVGGAETRFYRRTSVGQTGTPTAFRLCVSSGNSTYNATGTAYLFKNGAYTGSAVGIGGNTKNTANSGWVGMTDWNDLINGGTYIKITGAQYLFVYEIWYEVSYDPTPSYSAASGVAKTTGTSAYRTGEVTKSGSATRTGTAEITGTAWKTGTITLSGNSVANTVIADVIVVDALGYQDDASGTYTGVPNSLIERPNHVVKHLLAVHGGWPAGNFYTNASSYFSTKNYTFGGVISEKRKLKEWLTMLAFQCRCYFRIANGTAQLLWRPDTIASQKIITANMIRMQEDAKTTRRLFRSSLDEVINKIEVHYNRNWSQTGNNAYKAVSKTSDSASITAYGEKEKPELFYFDFVTTQAMADDVRDFYLARYKTRKKLVTMELFLDNVELEFRDEITITPQSNLVGEVQKVNMYPGSGKEMRNDKITVLVREY